MKDNSSQLLLMASRGGLSIPTEYCFAVSYFSLQLYSKISGDKQIMEKLLSINNQRAILVSAATMVAKV